MPGLPCLGQSKTVQSAVFALASRILSRTRLRRLGLCALLAAVVLSLGASQARAVSCTVSSTADTNTSGTLRYCLSNLDSGDPASTNTITFSATGTITLTGALPAITSGVTLTGPGANQLAISGNNSTNIFTIPSGAISVSISGLTLTGGNCGTSATYSAGAIAFNSSGTLQVSNSIFSDNSAPGGSNAHYVAGAIVSGYGGTVQIANSTFSNNSASNDAYSAGAILLTQGSLTVTGSTFYANSDSSTFGAGAILQVVSGTPNVTNSTFYQNSGSGSGAAGAITAVDPGIILTVNNDTFSGNSASGSSAVGGIQMVNSGIALIVANSIFTAETGGDCGGIGGGSGCPANGTNGNVLGSNVGLLPFGWYGGATETFLPVPSSPAVCAGNPANAVDANNNPLTTDQRGFPLSASNCSNSGVDAGAVQSAYLKVINTNDSGAGSLRAAVATANTAGYSDIGFDSSLNGQAINLSSGTLALTGTSGINIVGPGAGQLTVNGGGSSSNFSVFTVNSGVTATLYGLTVANGYFPSSGFGEGGGINNAGTLSLLDSVLTQNTSVYGGALANTGTVSVVDSTITGNTATSRAAVYNNNGGTMTVTESTISGNSGFAVGGVSNFGNLTLNGTTVSGNIATSSISFAAGGLDASYGGFPFTAANTIIEGNSAPNGSPSLPDTAIFPGNFTDNGGNLINQSTTPVDPHLGPLQLNGIGATTQTMMPLPGSTAICAGKSANIPSGVTTDQRGYPLQPASGYCSSTQVDAGAVQTNYTSVGFVQQPTDTAVNATISASPTVQVLETDTLLSAPNNTDAVNGIPITLTYSGGVAEIGGTLTQTTSGGVATFSDLTPNTTGTGFTLTAGPLATGGTGSPLSADSNPFTVFGLATHIIVTSNSNPVPFYTASGFSFVVADANGYTVANYNGSLVLSSSDPNFSNLGPVTITNGVGSINAAFRLAGLQTLTATDSTNSSLTGTTSFTVEPGWPTGLTVSAPASAYVGSPITFTVTAHDLFGNVAPSYTGTVHFTSTDASASLPTDYTFVAGDNGIHTFTATLVTPGAQTLSATDTGNSFVGASGSIAVAIPSFVVTTASDDAGTAGNCTVQASSSTGTDASCSLRDALLAAAAMGSGNITFDSTKFATATTLTLTNGTLTIPANTSITGATSGSGATLTNLVTIDGGGSASNFSIFTVNNGATNTALNNLIIANGHVDSNGGGIYNAGGLTVTDCTLTNNYAAGYMGSGNGGGGIYNASGTLIVNGSTFSGNTSAPGGAMIADNGTVTINNSTFSGNSALDSKVGGAIFINNATVTVNGSTFSGNTASGGGGGAIYNYGTLTIANSILAGNTGGDCGSAGSGTCPANGSNGNVVGVSSIGLAALGSYGGPTQSMIPLPGSPAICAGAVASIPVGVTIDQRGNARTTTYGSSSCADAGAVQTSYSIKFNQQPTDVVQYAAIAPAPTVELYESGAPFADGADAITIPLTLTTGSGTVTGGSAATSTTTGIATYSALSIDTPGTGDVLTASLTLNSGTTPATALSAVSDPFDVTVAVTQLAFTTAPTVTLTAGGNAGASVVVQEENGTGTLVSGASDTITLTVTGPNSYSKTYTQTATAGIATFDLSADSLTTTGGYSYSAAISGNAGVTAATANVTVNAAAAATVSVVSGSSQSATIGVAFSAPLTVKVVDQYNNPVPNATVVFTAPASGPSATFSTPAATAADGTTSATATANGLASATAYTVTASVSGATTSASFTLTNTPHSTALTVTPSATALVYGQPVTVNASIAPASVLTSSPSGSVTFYDGAMPLTPASTVASAAASYTVAVPAVGNHTYAAQYAGDVNFQQSALTNATQALVVSKASATLSGPGSAVNLTYGTGGTIAVNVAGQFSGAGIATPSGNVTYSINGGAPQTAALTSGAATLTIPATQASGNFTVAVSYAGDGNYNGATPIQITLNVAQATLTVAASSATKVYGTANPTFTGTVSGQQNGDTFTESFSTTATLSSPVGTYDIVPSVTGANLADYTQVIQKGTLTITQAATTTTLGISSASITPGQAETLTATVASATSGTPDGTVTFSDGSAPLATVALVNGVATYSTTTLTPGLTHVLSASYSGSTNFTASSTTSSASVTVAPLDFTMTLSGPASQTVIPGQSISYQVTVTPDYGSYAGTVSFTVAGLPTGATATFSPNTIAANGGAQTVTVTIQTATASISAAHTPAQPGADRRLTPYALAFLLLFGAGSLRKRGKAFRRLLCVAILLLGGAAAIFTTGCGGGLNGFFAQAPQNYTVTITAKAGNLQHSANVTLNLQ